MYSWCCLLGLSIIIQLSTVILSLICKRGKSKNISGVEIYILYFFISIVHKLLALLYIHKYEIYFCVILIICLQLFAFYWLCIYLESSRIFCIYVKCVVNKSTSLLKWLWISSRSCFLFRLTNILEFSLLLESRK